MLVAVFSLPLATQGLSGPAAAQDDPSSALAAVEFYSSFEDGEPGPDWQNTVETGPDGEDRAGGLDGGMTTEPGNGPEESPTAKTEAGFTGKHALRYAGNHQAEDRGYAYNKVFDTDVDITADSVLSYRLFPEMAELHQDYPATHAAVDLAFTDGTYLSELNAKDQHGATLSPTGQAESKTLYVNQWNHKESRIGTVAEGKTVDRILVAYDSPKGTAGFSGWVDDISLDEQPPPAAKDHYSDYVKTNRGTNSSSEFSRGNNLPATAVPNGFNFWTPVTNAGATNWLYEYAKGNNDDNLPTMQAFSASHQPSPWMGDRQTFQVMPSAAEGAPDASPEARALPFKHTEETATPHHYGVTFENGLRTDITPTDHAARMKFTFPGDDASVIFDNVDGESGLTLDTDNGEVTGYSDVKSGLSAGATRMFVYATFDSDVTDGGKLEGGGSPDAGYLRFDAGDDRTVNMRIATSLISVDQAKSNLEQEIPEDSSFEDTQAEAQQLWDDVLGRIEVEGASEDQLTTLYSNLYRLYLYPNSGHEKVGDTTKYASPFSEPEGENTPTETGAKILDGEVYVNNGFWDTYRTTWPAYSLITPERAGKMADGFVQHYKDGGWTSRWSSPGYADLMPGTSSDIAFADADAKGVEFDTKAAYDAALKNATVAPPNSAVGRKGMENSPFLGYTPNETGEGASWALEGYLNDAGIATMGERLFEETGEERYRDEAEYFRNRAQNYVKLFDDQVGFFQGKSKDGNWTKSPDDYDPASWWGDYTEANGWTFAFAAPQDTRGLANLYGGKQGLADKLDEFFSTPETGGDGAIHEMTEARDVRMGMYAHSNQPAHHIPYVYNAAGQPWKTQEKVREVLSRLYLGSEIGQGYAGDEDNGEASAWQVFSSLGFYPLVMGEPEYAIGSPQFTKATVHLDSGKELVIEAPNNSEENIYVQNLKVNGEDWTSTALPHDVLSEGGTLEFDMGPEPSEWGTGDNDGPTSITEGDEVPSPKGDVSEKDDGPLLDDTSDTEGEVSGDGSTIEVQDGAEVGSYTLTSPGDRSQAPQGWELQGANDDGEWTTVDQREGESFEWDKQTRVFALSEPGDYQRYRLVPSGGGGTVAEIELLG